MHHDPEMPGALQIAGGYVAAVAVAAFTAAVAIAAGEPGAPLLGIFVVGGVYIALTGLPGFALTVLLARRHGWSDWLPFAVTGGLNALVAWLLMNGTQGFGWATTGNELLLASIRGGVAGGMAYWWVAYHGLSRNIGAQPKMG